MKVSIFVCVCFFFICICTPHEYFVQILNLHAKQKSNWLKNQLYCISEYRKWDFQNKPLYFIWKRVLKNECPKRQRVVLVVCKCEWIKRECAKVPANTLIHCFYAIELKFSLTYLRVGMFCVLFAAVETRLHLHMCVRGGSYRHFTENKCNKNATNITSNSPFAWHKHNLKFIF